jgi:hypothetical protein
MVEVAGRHGERSVVRLAAAGVYDPARRRVKESGIGQTT